MTGLNGYLLFWALLAGAVLNPGLAVISVLLALGVFSFWPVDVSK